MIYLSRLKKNIDKFGYIISVLLLVAPIILFFIEGAVNIVFSDGTKEPFAYALSQFSFSYRGQSIHFKASSLLILSLVFMGFAMITLFLTFFPSKYRLFVSAFLLILPILSFFLSHRLIVVKDYGIFAGNAGRLLGDKVKLLNSDATGLTPSGISLAGASLLIINNLIMIIFGIVLNIGKNKENQAK